MYTAWAVEYLPFVTTLHTTSLTGAARGSKVSLTAIPPCEYESPPQAAKKKIAIRELGLRIEAGDKPIR